ncbi:MAG: DUF2461 family protein [Bacteroidetes bacterium]|nr:DUF2461 family protein [Bacteroidota bacterium]
MSLYNHLLFSFFQDLKKNNDRDWFNANKDRYIQSVRDPLLQMITDFDCSNDIFFGKIGFYFQSLRS